MEGSIFVRNRNIDEGFIIGLTQNCRLKTVYVDKTMCVLLLLAEKGREEYREESGKGTRNFHSQRTQYFCSSYH